jgi:hypothetical protein
MTPQERRAKFFAWRDDLEQRLAWHLFSLNVKDADPAPAAKRVIEVAEGVANSWDVYLNGKKLFHFTGPDAHSRALKASTELASF